MSEKYGKIYQSRFFSLIMRIKLERGWVGKPEKQRRVNSDEPNVKTMRPEMAVIIPENRSRNYFNIKGI